MSQYRGPLLILLASLFFSTTGTAQALAPEGATPLVIGAVRLWLGCLFVLIWCFFTKKLPSPRSWPLGRTVISALGILGYQMTFFGAVASTGVAVGTVVTCGSAPISAGLLAFLVLKEKPQRIWYVATVIAIIGLCLLSFSGDVKANPLGLILAVCASSSYAVYITFSKTLTREHEPETVIAVLFGIGAILIAPVFFIFPTDWIFTAKGVLVCIHLGLVTTAAGYVTYLMGLKSTQVSTAATINLSESLMAACWGIFLLHEMLTPVHIAGMLLLMLGTGVLTLKPR